MKLNKIQIAPNQFGPEIPAGLEFKSVTYRPETDDYWGDFEEGKNPYEIKCIQGRRELKARNLFASVQADINALNNDEATHFFSNLLATWYYDTPIIQQLAQKYGLDLADFFAKAKLQSDRL